MPAAPLSDDDRDDLSAYLDGEVDAATRTRVEARLNRDPLLRAEADALKRAWDMLGHLPKPPPSPTFASRTVERLSALRPSIAPTASLPLPISARRVPWGLLAGYVLGLMFGWLAVGMIRPKPPAAPVLDEAFLEKELRLIDALPLYAAVETLDFLKELDHPDRFGADALGP